MIIGIDVSRANRLYKTGVEWNTFHLIRALAVLDNTHTYWLYTDTPLQKELAHLGENFVEKQLRWPFVYLWTQGRLSLEMWLRPPEVLFISASILPFIHPKKTIAVIHDVAFRIHPELYSFLDRWYQELSVWLAARKNKKIIAVSQCTRNELIQHYHIRPENIHVVPAAYDQSLYHTKYTNIQKDEVATRYGIKKPYILSISSLSKKKNILTAIRSFHLFKSSPIGRHYTLVLAGKKGDDFDAIQNEVDVLGMRADVIFPGWVPRVDMPLLLAGAEIFFFLSLYEGFGIPVLEAFATGVPVICSDRGSLPEISHSAALVVDPLDVHAVHNAFKRITDDSVVKYQLIASGYERVKHFDYALCAQKTLEILLTL